MAGGDFPYEIISASPWERRDYTAKSYGRGRVFVNAMGHDVAAMKGIGFQTLMIRGIEWSGTGKVTYPVPKQLDAPKAPAAK